MNFRLTLSSALALSLAAPLMGTPFAASAQTAAAPVFNRSPLSPPAPIWPRARTEHAQLRPRS
ncbi:hypothetical protein QWZ10_00940 [Paracoccus cavernae]|uniref:Uncharacterized protein n=1 Tax=Paracoccus cavernae TaxID=1571207 RepID=A0ABT8D687_9RHOB|nr:hypothetical protein [Paracoccus cavernae]